uniref:beclin 1-associated autophagy-related key regulator-like isoform X1 n=1 Tax=Myxine glutinosa TaxID=7769 RepID=UPI00358F4885
MAARPGRRNSSAVPKAAATGTTTSHPSEDVSAGPESLSSLTDGPLGLAVAVERCPLCGSSRRRLTCARCAQRGDFVYRDGRPDGSYADKLARLNSLKKERQKYLERVQVAAQAEKAKGFLKWEIKCCKSKIELLKKAIEMVRAGIGQDNEQQQTLREEVQRGERRARKHQDKEEQIKRRLGRRRDQAANKHDELERFLQELGKTRRERVHELTTAIFPLFEVAPRPGTFSKKDFGLFSSEMPLDPDTSLHVSTVSKLAEARRTNYLSGQWVYSENNGETRVGIVVANITLPEHSDYSCYYNWLESRKQTAQAPDLEHSGPAYLISAALCHTAQLVSVLSHLLAVTLPLRLCYSEFCHEDLGRQRFIRVVNKLNTNVMHLCFSQAVNPERLHPLHPMRNLRYMIHLENATLGRSGPFEISAAMEDSMELVDAAAGQADESEADVSSGEEETDLGLEWETVPNPRFMEIPTQHLEGSPLETQLEESRQPDLSLASAASQPGGLVSSAVASVASIWRAYTGHR